MGNGYSRIPALWEQGVLRSTTRRAASAVGSLMDGREEVLLEESFRSMLTLERRRAERSRKPFVLMLLDASAFIEEKTSERFLSRISSVLLKSTRETDLIGWYEKGVVLGVIFTEVSCEGETPVTEILRSKVLEALYGELGRKVGSSLVVTTHLFPENKGDKGEKVADSRFYPDLAKSTPRKRASQVVKRVIDVLGSASLLLILSPLLAIISITIKLTSKGPVVFKQERLGQFGSKFRCLKFRTMYVNNDPKIHQEYVQRFINGQADSAHKESGKPAVYKIKNDSRVTMMGRLLRKTSLDELPQFWNVLMGEMSLVGPRPSLPYEFEIYDIWHRRRVLEVKPGITGLWQVSGRSRTCFDDMVRLDLRYSQSWSIWLDVKILLQTPGAVLSGDGAY
ncbi:MAG TPA: sugar transferase [Candidatus Acidoferrum sp.]|nr:sugar transferase [Candidatus Acidoferrum sp.]